MTAATRLIEIDHHDGTAHGGRWTFARSRHPTIIGAASTRGQSIDNAYHAARHCLERATGGVTS